MTDDGLLRSAQLRARNSVEIHDLAFVLRAIIVGEFSHEAKLERRVSSGGKTDPSIRRALNGTGRPSGEAREKSLLPR